LGFGKPTEYEIDRPMVVQNVRIVPVLTDPTGTVVHRYVSLAFGARVLFWFDVILPWVGEVILL
jgi:hypothetical protein